MSAVVVGAGVAGLAAAYRLACADEQVTVLEASDRVGGMVRPVELAGRRVDAGAEAFARRRQVVDELCAELGLEVEAPAHRPRIRWSLDRSWTAADGVLGVPGSPDDRSLWEALPDHDLVVARVEPYLPPALGADATTLAELVDTRLGRGVTQRLVAPVTRCALGREPDQVLLHEMAPALVGPGSLYAKVAAARGGRSSVARPADGLFRLVEALADRVSEHGGSIRLNQAVTGLQRAGEGWQVEAGEPVVADRVVLACPGSPASELLGQVGVEVSPTSRPGSVSVLLAVEAAALGQVPLCSGVLMGRPVPGLRARALTWYTAKWPAGDDPVAVLRVSYPPGTEPTPDLALADAGVMLGCELEEALDAVVTLWPKSPVALAPQAQSELLAALPPGLHVAGAWAFGNGVEAAVGSGLAAAS